MQCILPQNIRWRADKVGYAAPLDNWLRKELFSWGRERVFDTRLQNIPGYDFELIQKQWKEHIEDGINNSWALWKWISLSEWLENFNKGLWRCTTVLDISAGNRMK